MSNKKVKLELDLGSGRLYFEKETEEDSETVEFVNKSGMSIIVKTYNQKDNRQMFSFAKYKLSPGQSMIIQARGDSFINLWVNNT